MGRATKGTPKAKPPKATTPAVPEPTMYTNWTRDTVSVADAVSQHRNRRYNAADLIARVEGTIEFCVRTIAEACNAVPQRLYTHGSSDIGKRWGKSITRKQRQTIRNPMLVGKAAGYAGGSDEVVEVEWHPIMDLLANPNAHMSGQEYDLLLWDHELTGGTAFEYVAGKGMPQALLPLYPVWVTPQPSKTDLISGYWYYRGTPAETFYERGEVDAYRIYPDRSNPYIGRSPLRGIIKQADLAAAIVVEALSRIQNDCRPDHAWVSELPIDSTQQQAVEQRLSKYRGPRNKGKPVVVGGMKPVPLQFSYKDMEWKDLADKTDRAIITAYGVPESLLEMNDANLASAEAGLRAFFALTIQPKVRMRAEQRTDMLLRRYGVEPGSMWFAPDNASGEDEERQSRVLVSYTGGTNPILTVNEARAELGYEPVEWGDRPQLGGLLGVPGGTDEPIDVEGRVVDEPKALPEASAEGIDPAATGGAVVQDTALNGAQVTSLVDLASQVAAGKLPVDSAVAIAAAAFPAVPPETVNAIFDPLRNFTPAPDPEAVNANPSAGGESPDEPDAEPPEDDAEPVGEEASTKKAAMDSKLMDRIERLGYIDHNGDHVLPDHMSSFIRTFKEREKSLEVVTASGFWFRDDHGPGCQCERHKAIDPSAVLLSYLADWYDEWGPTFATASASELPALALDARKQLATILRPELERLFRDGLVEVLSRAGQEAPQSLGEAAARGVDVYVSRLTGNVTETVLTDVKQAIERSITEGMNLTEATREVADAMKIQADWRAERVARTETARAVEYGRVEGYAEVGVEKKQWLISNAPCQFCESAVLILRTRSPGGTPLRDPFFRAGETIVGTAGGVMVLDQDIMVPSDIHPNDACSVSGVWNV